MSATECPQGTPKRSLRAWSAPASTLLHARVSGDCRLSVIEAGKRVRNPRLAYSSVSTLFPARVSASPSRSLFAGHGEPLAVPRKAVTEKAPLDTDAVTADDCSPSHDNLRAQLESAKSQIYLLNMSSEQTLRTYSALEVEHRRLTAAYTELEDNYEKLLSLLGHKDEVIEELQQRNGHLQRKLECVDVVQKK